MRKRNYALISILMISSSTLFLALGTSNIITWLSSSDPLIAETEYGTVKGKEWNQKIYSWLGVPFAKPPIGDLRWKAPEDPEPWVDTLMTTEFSEPCMQFAYWMGTDNEDDILNDRIIGSEDCLYLNIWTPKTLFGGIPNNLPVYLFVHGGGNTVGQANWPMYYGGNLAEKGNCIVVTINYRLDIVGWLYHPTLETGNPLEDSGNFALLDIIKACEWVKENIENFGGNPDKVTIAGQSAGSMNLMALLTSPYVKQEYFDKGNKLFDRCVLQSGGMMPQTMSSSESYVEEILASYLVYKGIAMDEDQAEALVAGYSNEEIEALLRDTPMLELFECRKSEDGSVLDVLSTPSVLGDGYVAAEFINAYERLIVGDYIQIPTIIGCCEDEFKIFIAELIADEEQYYNAMFGHYVPDNLEEFFELIRPWSADYAPYLDWILEYGYSIVSDTTNTFIKFFMEELPARLMNIHQDNIYVYQFIWKQSPEPYDFLIGAAHGMDLPFIFGNIGEDESFPLSNIIWTDENKPGRVALSDAMIAYWRNFMEDGDPGDPDGGWWFWEGLPNWDNFDEELLGLGKERIIFDATLTEVDIYMDGSLL